MCRVCTCVDMQVHMSVDICLRVYLHVEVDNGCPPLSVSTWHDEAESELELADSSWSSYRLALGMPCLSASMVLGLQRAAMPSLHWRRSRDPNLDPHTCAPDTPMFFSAASPSWFLLYPINKPQSRDWDNNEKNCPWCNGAGVKYQPAKIY